MKLNRISILAGAVALSMSLPACWNPARVVDRALAQGINSATNRVSDELGKAIADHILLTLTPEVMRAYSMGLFQVLFYHGGYYFDLESYQPGDYTRWQAEGVEHGDWFEKALLRREDDGSEWWRVEVRTKAERERDQAHLTMEALFSPAQDDGTRRILRMRALFPEEKEVHEIPVRERDSEQWILYSDRTLTPESLEALTVGRTEVATQAGTFATQHLRSGQPGYGALLNWWVVDAGVPGRVVKYTQEYREDENDDSPQVTYEVELLKFGSDAIQSKLDSF